MSEEIKQEMLTNPAFYSVFSLLLMLLLLVMVIFFTIKLSFFINIRLKKIKIQRISKKKNLSNYTLRTNHKGMPIMLVNIENPSDIIIL